MPSQRAAFTIVEVLVALLLISVALLGFAGSSAIALRATLDANRRHEAALALSSRLALLESQGCASMMAGATTTSRWREHWSIRLDSAGFASVADSLDLKSAHGTRTMALEGAVTC